MTSGRQSSMIARKPGSAAAVSMRPKNSPTMRSLAVSRSSFAKSAMSGIHSCLGGSSNGANARPVRSALAVFWRCAAIITA